MTEQIINKETINQSIKEIEEGYMVLWTYQNLHILKLTDQDLNSLWNDIKIDDIVKVRIFNKTKEHHYWRSGKTLKVRRMENDPENKIERQMILNGDVAEQIKKYFPEAPNKPLAIKTYHFYEPNDIGQVGYVDMRFVNFETV